MEDDIPSPISHFRRHAAERVRRRIYVAMIIAFAVFTAGLLYWPLKATRFRTYAEIMVQMQVERPTASALNSSAQDREARLQAIIRDCLRDDVLAHTIREATFDDVGGVAQLQVGDVRRHLAVGLTRDDTLDSPIRWVQVIWTGNSSPGVQRFVNVLSQEIASRAAREVRLDSIQLELEERFDQIARQQSSNSNQMALVVEQARQQIERQRSTLQALQQKISSIESNRRDSDASNLASIDSTESSESVQDQVATIKRQMLSTDSQLLTLLRQQVIHHFEVDETDGLVQHIDRLIQDRETILAQLLNPATPRATVVGGEATVGSDSSNTGRSQVRSNPFFMASAPIRRSEVPPSPYAELQATLGELQVESLVTQLQQLQGLLSAAAQQKLPVIDLSNQLRREAPSYRVIKVQPAQVSLPLDAAPTPRWAFGLGLIAVMVGTAFTLQNSPETLARTLFRPSQLAGYLGIDHLGTIRTAKPKPNLIDNVAKVFGRRVFQAAEVVVLLGLGGVLMAMVWEPQLPSVIMQHPLEGLCQAFWILMGR